MKHRRAFSLTELLVVIAIVGLLISMLLPVLARGRAQGSRVKCISNLRQLGIAARLYWEDHEGQSFRYHRGQADGGELYWFGWIAPGAEGHRKFDATRGALFPYLGAAEPGLCPSLNAFLPDFKRKASVNSFNYGYNLAMSPPPAKPPLRVDLAGSPATLAVFGDAAQVNTFQPPASPDNPMLEEFYYLSSGEATAHFRHSWRANVVFLDGHAGGENPQAGSLDARLASARVGRLRGELLSIP